MNYFFLTFVFLLSIFKAFPYEGGDIMEIQNIKRSIYRDTGIFHNGIKDNKNVLNSIRHSGKLMDSYERIVFDFKEGGIPQVYAHIDQGSKKLQIDFLRTKLGQNLNPAFKSHRVREINLFPLADDVLSAELLLKENTYVEIFSLKNPARLVIDFKN